MPGMRWGGLSLPAPRRLRRSPLNLIHQDLAEFGATLKPSTARSKAFDLDPY